MRRRWRICGSPPGPGRPAPPAWRRERGEAPRRLRPRARPHAGARSGARSARSVSQKHLDKATDALPRPLSASSSARRCRPRSIRPAGARRFRCLPPRRPDQRMGYGRGPCRARGRGRHRHHLRRRAPALWQAALPQPGLCRLGPNAAGATAFRRLTPEFVVRECYSGQIRPHFGNTLPANAYLCARARIRSWARSLGSRWAALQSSKPTRKSALKATYVRKPQMYRAMRLGSALALASMRRTGTDAGTRAAGRTRLQRQRGRRRSAAVAGAAAPPRMTPIGRQRRSPTIRPAPSPRTCPERPIPAPTPVLRPTATTGRRGPSRRTRSSRPATASSAPSPRASPASSSTPSSSRAARTATSWARTPAAPSSPACATARARSTPRTPAPTGSTGRGRRSATTWAATAPR